MAPSTCKIESITPLTKVVYEVILAPEQPMEFTAGQYVKVVMNEGDERPFSIANPPHENNKLVLQIGATQDNPYAWEVMEKLRASETITVSAPTGNAYVRVSDRPLLLIAGGTGFSYTFSILKSVLHNTPDKVINFYWGVRHIEDLYYVDQLNTLASQHKGFTFYPVVEFAEAEWQGLTGWVHKAVMQNQPDLLAHDVYVAGRFDMAKTIRDDFTDMGLPANQLFGDAFDYI
ncbi:NAD(P)H-flavin reductase [Alteromonas facilis]|uniref:NAD(P)H-flavin reductase n=1 Tax=Alteromonas facilis TaxID=2048004 RepID=UPI000C28D325|nr:NAD(P)H-flavin reductase [Alteromonas facilis]